MSALRARCPACSTLTAVAIDDGYECHVCGRTFSAGLVRVAGAWGDGGETMAEAATAIQLPWPEAAVIVESSLEAQNAAVAAALPVRPVLLGGCCCSHIGAIRGLAARHGQLAVVWLDAHGDVNTLETSPSGNAWGMPLRMSLDAGDVVPANVALVGARDLDPPEQQYLAATGIDDDIERALSGTDAVYVAFDVDVLAPGEIECFMPCTGGPSVGVAEEILHRVAAAGSPVAGMGFSGLRSNCDPMTLVRLADALGV
jgi:arginase